MRLGETVCVRSPLSNASWVGLASEGSSDSDPDIIFRCFSLTLLIIGQTLVLLFNFCLAISFIVS